MEKILLNKILTITDDEFNDWTLCLNNAPNNNPQERENLYSINIAPERMMEHLSWKKAKGKKISFRKIDTKYCLQFIRLDKDQKYDNWLFIGAFENKGIKVDEKGNELYDLKPLDRFSEFNERLIIEHAKKKGPKQAKLNISLIKEIVVVKILEKPYIKVNRPFEGLNKLSISFFDLKQIIDQNIDSWRDQLSKNQCVYVITDKTNGKLYIGSTYGEGGIWQRWKKYADTYGTGGNVVLDELVQYDEEYALNNFKFTILESFVNTGTNELEIIGREEYWKKVFTSIENGYNKN